MPMDTMEKWINVLALLQLVVGFGVVQYAVWSAPDLSKMGKVIVSTLVSPFFLFIGCIVYSLGGWGK